MLNFSGRNRIENPDWPDRMPFLFVCSVGVRAQWDVQGVLRHEVIEFCRSPIEGLKRHDFWVVVYVFGNRVRCFSIVVDRRLMVQKVCRVFIGCRGHVGLFIFESCSNLSNKVIKEVIQYRVGIVLFCPLSWASNEMRQSLSIKISFSNSSIVCPQILGQIETIFKIIQTRRDE